MSAAFRPDSRLPIAAIPICLLLLLSLGGGRPAAAQEENRQWVRDEVRLNLRTGPGAENRVVGVLKTGNVVEVLKQQSDWTEVRLEDGREGWIPVGYLVAQPPAALRVAELETRLAEQAQALESLRGEAEMLRRQAESLTAREGEQRRAIEKLRLEGGALSENARWTEWITGAAILVIGMVAGAMLHRNARRHPSPRIRL